MILGKNSRTWSAVAWLLFCLALLTADRWSIFGPGELAPDQTSPAIYLKTSWTIGLGFLILTAAPCYVVFSKARSESMRRPVLALILLSIASYCQVIRSEVGFVSRESIVFLAGIALCTYSSLIFRNIDAFKFALIGIGGLFLLAAVGIVKRYDGGTYYYHGARRWNGVWSNPNQAGLLMAMLWTSCLTCFLALSGTTHGNCEKTSKSRKLKILRVGLLIAGTTGLVGLIASFSRGAWLAALVGSIAVLYGAKIKQSSPVYPLLFRNRFLVAGAAFALVIVDLHYSLSNVYFRRFLSIANENDFSWRNRVTHWCAGLQMIGDRPVLGWGWEQMRSVFDLWYCPMSALESGGIATNDFITLAAILGLPAFVVFAGLLMRQYRPGSRENPRWEEIGFRALASILVSGMFFDGGIFTFAISVPFWVIMARGFASSHIRAHG